MYLPAVADVSDDLRIDPLPHRLAERRLGAFPECAADFANGQRADEATIDIRFQTPEAS